ncbi:MAG: metal ABC transporter permease, partial [Neisseriaceae bacterium]|nr:metal ABC transporter permease [Neisseriaceae bacterium]
YRPLLIESVDSTFLRIVKGRGGVWHIVFLMLVVINLVAGFQTLGTLMSVGLMMLPAICSRMWFSRMETLLIGSILIAVLASVVGLLLSFYVDIPSGPAVILICGVIYFFSLLFATNGILMPYIRHKRHRKLSK